jgi:tetratricopeptide (TPR) repeat protein
MEEKENMADVNALDFTNHSYASVNRIIQDEAPKTGVVQDLFFKLACEYSSNANLSNLFLNVAIAFNRMDVNGDKKLSENELRARAGDQTFQQADFAEITKAEAVTTLRTEATRMMQNDNAGDAQIMLQKAVEVKPDDKATTFRFLDSILKFDRNDDDLATSQDILPADKSKALSLLAALEKADPDDVMVNHYRGSLLMRTGDYAGARKEFTEYINSAKTDTLADAEAHGKISYSYLKEKNFAEALKSADTAIVLNPNNVRAWCDKAQACEGIADEKKAKNPKDPTLRAEYTKARDAYRKTAQLEKESSEPASVKAPKLEVYLRKAAEMEVELGNKENAIADYKGAFAQVDANPNLTKAEKDQKKAEYAKLIDELTPAERKP